MSHFNHAANSWDSEDKIKMMQNLAIKTRSNLHLNNKIDILDFGCGTGLFSLEFLDVANSITGIDTSDGMLDVLKKKTSNYKNIKTLNIDLENSEIDLKFDLIISSMAFHHLNSPKSILLKLSKLLNTNGQIAIVDLESEDGSFHPDPKAMGVKHFGFSNEEIESWAKDANLSVEISTISTRKKAEKEFKQFLAVFKVRGTQDPR